MAVSMIPNPNTMPVKNEENPGSGTSDATILICNQIKVGKIVFISARIKINVSMSYGMDMPLLKLNKFTPAAGAEGGAPSVLKIDSAIYMGLIRIQKFSSDGNFYALQRAQTNVPSGTMIEMFFCYETE